MLAHPLDRRLTALADDVCCTELLRQCNPVRMTPEEDDLLGAEPLGGDDPAQPDCAVADYSRGLPWADFRSRAAWWPVPITSDRARSDGINASSTPTDKTT